MAIVRQVQITFDCTDPVAVSSFWKAVLGYVDPPIPPGFTSWNEFNEALPPDRKGAVSMCVDPAGVGPRLFFQRVPEPKAVKNRQHLDVIVAPALTGDARTEALLAEAERLKALGAKVLKLNQQTAEEEAFIVMQDIEGNEFCLD